VLAILHCLAFIDRTMIGGALPLMRLDLPMTDAGAGWLIGTAFAVPYGVTALALAAMLRGRRASPWWLIGGVAVWTAATLVTGAAQSTTMLMLARAGLGIGQAMFVPVAIAWLVARLQVGGFTLLDCQFMTEHLASLGAVEIPRAAYLVELSEALSGAIGSDASASGVGDFFALDRGAAAPEAAPAAVDSGPPSGKVIAQLLTHTS